MNTATFKVYWLDGHEEIFNNVENYSIVGQPPALLLKISDRPTKHLPYYLIRWFEEVVNPHT